MIHSKIIAEKLYRKTCPRGYDVTRACHSHHHTHPAGGHLAHFLRAMAERGISGDDSDNSNGTVAVTVTAAANSHRVRCAEFKAI
jgi:hypothetical protein